MRLLLFLLLIFALYYLLKRAFGVPPRQPGPFREPRRGAPPPVSDELVKDPVCGVYCPKSSALTERRKGQVYYFCSAECRDRFRRDHDAE